DPATNTLFEPTNDWCNIIEKDKEAPQYNKGLYLGGSPTFDPWDQALGRLTAFNASDGSERWRYSAPKPLLAGVTVTSGGVLFTGEITGDFAAIDSSTGKFLYRFNAGGPIAGGVITYQVQGRQYVAAVSGFISDFFALSGGDQGGTPTIVLFSLP